MGLILAESCTFWIGVVKRDRGELHKLGKGVFWSEVAHVAKSQRSGARVGLENFNEEVCERR